MNWSLVFVFNSILLGIGLAMDAFSVSMANGLNEPGMKKSRMLAIAGVFAGFQALMPMIGWACVHTIAERFEQFQKAIPWIALILLVIIGGNMIREGIHPDEGEEESKGVSFGALMLQGVATSIDALSVGFTIADYGWLMAWVCALIIAVVTLAICLCGLRIGRTFGTKLAGKAAILGGCILIIIGIEIFINSGGIGVLL